MLLESSLIRPFLLAPLAGWALLRASLSLEGVLPTFHVFYSLHFITIPSSGSCVILRYFTPSLSKSLLVGSFVILPFIPGCSREVSEPTHLPNDLLTLLYGTPARDRMHPWLFPVKCPLRCVSTCPHMLPSQWVSTEARDSESGKGPSFSSFCLLLLFFLLLLSHRAA